MTSARLRKMMIAVGLGFCLFGCAAPSGGEAPFGGGYGGITGGR